MKWLRDVVESAGLQGGDSKSVPVVRLSVPSGKEIGDNKKTLEDVVNKAVTDALTSLRQAGVAGSTPARRTTDFAAPRGRFTTTAG